MHNQLAAGSFGSMRVSGRRGRDHGLLAAKTRSSIHHNGFRIAAVRRTSYQSRYCLNCSGNLKARLAPVY